MARSKLAPSSTSLAASPSASTSSANACRGHRLGLRPGRRAHEGEARRQRRLARRHRGERRAGDRPRVGVLLVEADQRLGEQRGVLDRAREHADMVERARQQQRAAARDQAVRRLEADDAAEGGRADHRAVGLRADGARHHERRHRRRRAARRAARRALGVVRVAGLAGMEVGVLGGDGLAHDHGAGGAQPGHRRGIAARRAAGPQGRAELGRHVAGVEDVLDADRHAVQRARSPCRAGGARRRPRPARRA